MAMAVAMAMAASDAHRQFLHYLLICFLYRENYR
jgi:hypothetical protein